MFLEMSSIEALVDPGSVLQMRRRRCRLRARRRPRPGERGSPGTCWPRRARRRARRAAPPRGWRGSGRSSPERREPRGAVLAPRRCGNLKEPPARGAGSTCESPRRPCAGADRRERAGRHGGHAIDLVHHAVAPGQLTSARRLGGGRSVAVLPADRLERQITELEHPARTARWPARTSRRSTAPTLSAAARVRLPCAWPRRGELALRVGARPPSIRS